MKLKTTLLTLGTIVALTSSLQATETAEGLYDAKCAACHTKTRPTDMSKVVAPALMGVMRHIKMAYPNKDEAVKFMVDYILGTRKIYGNALKTTMMENRHIQKHEVRMSLFIMKHVLMKMMLGRGNYILNQGKVSYISNRD